jgi:hypothetical protein
LAEQLLGPVPVHVTGPIDPSDPWDGLVAENVSASPSTSLPVSVIVLAVFCGVVIDCESAVGAVTVSV